MTLPIETPYISYKYFGPDDFPFSFAINTTSDISVFLIATDGIEYELAAGTDFTVAKSGFSGGTVTVISAPTTSGYIHILRSTELNQLVDLVNNGPLDVDSLEAAYDKLTMICQDLDYTFETGVGKVQGKGTWTTSTQYPQLSIVLFDTIYYAATSPHMSSFDFASDLANGLWVIFMDMSDVLALAQAWAENPEDVPVVEPDSYSAFHWAMKAANISGITWKNRWATGSYLPNDMVLDEPWTMIANKGTEERAGPQPTGAVHWAYDDTGDTMGSALASNVKQLIFGNRYTTTIGKYGYKYRFKIVAGNSYQVYSVKDPLGAGIFKLLVDTTPDISGWVEISVSTTIIKEGTLFDLIVVAHQPDPTSAVFSGTWNYRTPNNLGGDPGEGRITHANNNPDMLRIHHLDDVGDDRAFELNTLLVGDTIAMSGLEWAIQSIDPIDTNWTDFYIAPESQASNDGLQKLVFTQVNAVDITYPIEVDGWLLDPNVQGLFIADGGWDDIVPDDNAYGVDFESQDARVSPDWDFVAHSEIGESSGGGGSSPVFNGPGADGLVPDPITASGLVLDDSGNWVTAPAPTFDYGDTGGFGLPTTINIPQDINAIVPFTAVRYGTDLFDGSGFYIFTVAGRYSIQCNLNVINIDTLVDGFFTMTILHSDGSTMFSSENLVVSLGYDTYITTKMIANFAIGDTFAIQLFSANSNAELNITSPQALYVERLGPEMGGATPPP